MSPETITKKSAAKVSTKSAAKPEPVDRDLSKTAWLVRFDGYDQRRQDGRTLRITESEGIGDGLRWRLYDNGDVGPAGRENREPRRHPTKHQRYFYHEEDALAYEGVMGFTVEAPKTGE